MTDQEFFDELFQMYARTAGVENSYWMYEELEDGGYDIFAVSEDDKVFVGYTDQEADADFITALHGSFGDIYRFVLELIDEADRLDNERDRLQNELAELTIRVMELENG